MTTESRVRAALVLEDGSIFSGRIFGSGGSAVGEVVFNTAMTGYQEMLTDPSYAGQILVATYPLIGNYGVNEYDFESEKVQVSGFVVREHCLNPSHSMSQRSLDDFLRLNSVVALSDVDTRAITRRLRTAGVMKGMIVVDELYDEAIRKLGEIPDYGDVNYVNKVSTRKPYNWQDKTSSLKESETGQRIFVSDCGLKYNILRNLQSRGCNVHVVPSTITAAELIAQKPDGVVLSPGPGNPDLLDHTTNMARNLIGKMPILGICLGNQVIACAFGGRNYKLKFGHRGGNHPVRDVDTGLVHITAQNHGYAIDPDSLPREIKITHVNLNDDTVEGIRHTEYPVMGIQYHSEASPGPRDNEYIFDKFLDMVRDHAIDLVH